MTEKKDATTIIIRYQGPFTADSIEDLIRNFMDGRDYGAGEVEGKYAGNKRDMKLEGDKTISDISKATLTISFKASDITHVDMLKDGKKLTIQEGKVTVKIEGAIEIDWPKRFDKKNSFIQSLRDIYHKYIIGDSIGKDMDELETDMNDLAQKVRTVLELEG